MHCIKKTARIWLECIWFSEMCCSLGDSLNDFSLALTQVRRLLRDNLPLEVKHVLDADVILHCLRGDSYLKGNGTRHPTSFFPRCDCHITAVFRDSSPLPLHKWSPVLLLWSRTFPDAPGRHGYRSLRYNVSQPSQEYLQLWSPGHCHEPLSGPNHNSPAVGKSVHTVGCKMYDQM